MQCLAMKKAAHSISGGKRLTLLGAALGYARRGWAVFPCLPSGKAPMHKGGFKNATTDLKQITAWWAKTPNANIGIATGAASGLVVYDLDKKNGIDGEANFHTLFNGHNVLPPTLEIETPSGGKHLYFTSVDAGTIRCSTGTVAAGVDVRGEGGYVVAPPSATGAGAYTVARAGDPAPLPPIPNTQPVAQPAPDVPLQTLRAALAHVNADEYLQWVNTGQALKHAYGDAGQAAWAEWSKTSHKYKAGDDAKWETFDLNRDRPLFTVRSIVATARKNGYRPTATEFEDGLLKAFPLAEFLDIEFKPRVMLLDPVISSQSLGMIYGPRGIGKTRTTATMAIAAASGGSAFGWKATRPVNTLYLDGEMAGADIQGLFKSLWATAPKSWDGSTLRIVTPDAQSGGGIPDLSTAQGQQVIAEVIGDAELIFVDNLSAWVRGAGEENSAESWMPMLDWLLRMRSQGRSVMLVHHAGKSGQQRGTSKREDMLDVVLALRRPANHVAQDGARFELHFEKARGLHGEAVAPIEAQYSVDTNGVPKWVTRPLSHTAQILALHADGTPQADIARELGVNRSTVSRAINRHTMPPVEPK